MHMSYNIGCQLSEGWQPFLFYNLPKMFYLSYKILYIPWRLTVKYY
jgi:hypothetical protein